MHLVSSESLAIRDAAVVQIDVVALEEVAVNDTIPNESSPLNQRTGTKVAGTSTLSQNYDTIPNYVRYRQRQISNLHD